MADKHLNDNEPPQNADVPSQPTVWQPPPTNPTAFTQQRDENRSGLNDGVPPQIAAYRWNWGAFLLTFLWCISHKLYRYAIVVFAICLIDIAILMNSISIVVFVYPFGPTLFVMLLIVGSVVTFGLQIYLGMRGHRLAWENRRFDGDIDQYLEVQTIWMRWAMGLAVLYILLGIWVWHWIKAQSPDTWELWG